MIPTHLKRPRILFLALSMLCASWTALAAVPSTSTPAVAGTAAAPVDPATNPSNRPNTALLPVPQAANMDRSFPQKHAANVARAKLGRQPPGRGTGRCPGHRVVTQQSRLLGAAFANLKDAKVRAAQAAGESPLGG